MTVIHKNEQMHKSVQNAQKCKKVLHETKVMKQTQPHADIFATFQRLTDTIWKLNHINDEEYR